MGKEAGQSQLLVKEDTKKEAWKERNLVVGRDSWGLKWSEVRGDTGTGRGGVG